MNNETKFRQLRNTLNKGVCYYTYENKQTRSVKVLVRGLHQTCKTETIKTDLLTKGLKIEKVTNILKHERSDEGIIKKPLPLFMI